MKRAVLGALVLLVVAASTVVRIASLSDDKERSERALERSSAEVEAQRRRIDRLEARALEDQRTIRRVRSGRAALYRNLQRVRRKLSARTCFWTRQERRLPWNIRRMRGDVDGDGLVDRVSLEAIPGPEPGGCRYSLRVRSATADHELELGDERRLSKFDVGPGFFVDLNGEPGYEVLIRTGRPAAGELFTSFALSDHGLAEVVREDGRSFPVANYWTPGVGGNIDCLPGGLLVHGTYSWKANDHRYYQVTRTLYDVDGAVARKVGSQRFTVREGDLSRFPELSGPDDNLVRSCPRP